MEDEGGRVDGVFPSISGIELEINRERLVGILAEDPLATWNIERVVKRPTVNGDGTMRAALYKR